MEETFSLKEVFAILKKRFLLITIITVLAMVTAGVISFFILTPIYQSSTQIIVNKKTEQNVNATYNDIQANLGLINTYNVVIKSPAILDLVIKELDLDKTVGQLTQMITVASEKNSQVMSITVENADAKLARDIANTVATIFKQEVGKIMNVDNVSILAKAELLQKSSPIKPNPTLNIAIATVLGLMVSVGIAFLLEYLDNTVKNENELEKLLGLPVLGTVSLMSAEDIQNPIPNSTSKFVAKNVG